MKMKPITPNACTAAQAHRFVGVSRASVAERETAGKLHGFEWFGTRMYRVVELRAWKRERERRHARQGAILDGAR